jgi:DNA adenine methylase
MTALIQPLKWHGGKGYLADDIVGLFRPHLHYVEPYAGGLATLLARDPLSPSLQARGPDGKLCKGVSEVANDAHRGLMDFWRVLADPDLFADFRRRMEATPFSEEIYERVCAYERQHGRWGPEDKPVLGACAFFVACRFSLSGRMRGFTGVTKTRTRRGMNNEVSAWLSVVEGLPAVHERLLRVLFLCRPALEVIAAHDQPTTLQYLDPTYIPATRVTPKVYKHEMTYQDHMDLLDLITSCKGSILISGYPHAEYERRLSGWQRHEFSIPNHASGSRRKRTMQEVVWKNY